MFFSSLALPVAVAAFSVVNAMEMGNIPGMSMATSAAVLGATSKNSSEMGTTPEISMTRPAIVIAASVQTSVSSGTMAGMAMTTAAIAGASRGSESRTMPGMKMSAESTGMAKSTSSTGMSMNSSSSSMSLTMALGMQNKTLSTLNSLIANQPKLLAMLATAGEVTILAPSNEAFSKFLSTPGGTQAAKDPGLVSALLTYHVLNGSLPSSAFTKTMTFAHSMLTNQSFTNVTSGQVVGAVLNGKTVEIMSGVKEISKVISADIKFNGGVVHIIDTVLTLPMSPAMTAMESELTSLVGALTQTNLVSAVDDLKDVTIFAPSNAAFQAIGSATGNLSMMQLTNILEYHVIKGTVGYSSLLAMGLANQTIPTLMGADVNIEAVDGKIFVNSAQVTIPDVIVSNGVVHVISNVLNPGNTTAMPVPTATSQAVAFADASSASNVPFTSGISATTTAPSASTKTAGAMGSVEIGNLGMGVALLGMGVLAL